MSFLVKILWAIVSALIIVFGIYFTGKLGFVQFRMKEYKKSFLHTQKDKNGISPLSTLMLTLAGRIGVGSIAGIALAIYIGGPGTIFWIWMISLVSLPLAFMETVLGSLYKRKYKNEYVGGPSYYILKGLKKRKLAYLYALLVLLSFFAGFLGIQVNTIVKATVSILPISKITVGIILMILTFIIIVGDIKTISSVTSKIVPFMLIFYATLCLFVIVQHIDKVYPMIIGIIQSAFSFKPFFSGFLYAMIIGIQRGIFSSETGVGTGSITASASNSLNPKKDGYLQMLGVSITTLVVCTITAFIVLLSPYQNLMVADPNGIEVASFAFGYHFHTFGIILMFIFIFLCSFSTILTGYYDALVSLRFLTKKETKWYKWFLIGLTVLMIFISSMISSSLMWQFVDFFVGFLILINLYSIFFLKEDVKKVLKER